MFYLSRRVPRDRLLDAGIYSINDLMLLRKPELTKIKKLNVGADRPLRPPGRLIQCSASAH